MGLPAEIKRLISSIVPAVNRGGGGAYVTALPHGAGLLGAAAKTLAGKATALNYGAIAQLQAAVANVVPSWAEGIIFTNPQVAKKDYYVAITTAAAITAAAQILAEVPFHANVITETHYVPLGQRVFIPAGVNINAALAESSGGKTCDVWLVVSRGK